jgi:hypothetical protein
MTLRIRVFLWATILLIVAVPTGRTQTIVRNPHGPLPVDCAVCHRTADWSVGPRTPGFDHGRVGFPLVGKHLAVKCRDCHEDLAFSHVGSACVDCHLDIHRGQLGSACERCHSPAGWENRGQVYDQHAARGFPLVGAHAAVDCEGCHLGQQRQEFVRTPVSCYGCHRTQYDRTGEAGIPHAQLGFSTDCSQCHTPASSWGPTVWNHLSRSGFALTGRHETVACLSCHPNGRWVGLPRDCYGCHGANYSSANSPPHASLNFPHDCTQCHNTTSWGDGTFDHSSTGFALTGAHATAVCTTCHANGQWAGLPQDCYSCHTANYNATSSPQHAASGFPTTCQTCHTTAAWQPSSWNHTSTGFVLTGAHLTAVCTTCHANGQWTGLPHDCYTCHTANYNAANDPPHASLNFPHDCTQCHSTSGWGGGTFDHAATGFALTGAHVTAACTTCHANGQWAGLPQDCYTCHTISYNGANDPPHASLNFPHDCTQCHSTTSWGGGTFDHTTTGFALTGAHVAAACTTCHANGQWAGLPQDCYSCHTTNYNGANDPPHVTLNFPHDCTQCHNTGSWGDGTFNHTTTGFALTGAHVTAACSTCHANGQWTGLPQDCYSCHTANYNSANDPPHVTLNFPHDCTQCHNTGSWGDGTFNHTTTGFALTGAHLTAVCTTCHANGQWAGLPQDCYSCHTATYNSANDPPHASLNFPHDCAQCHNTGSWGDGTFDHTSTGFALTGAHTTANCTTCHANGQWAGLPQICFGCHAANYNDATVPQHAASGFPTTCETCHTTAAWQPSSWSHASVGFALTGAHATAVCTTCHANGRWAGLPGDCFSCHTANYNSTTDPPHATLSFPHDCTQCHNTSTWGDGTFDHTSTGFVLTGAHATAVCTSCHANGQWLGLPQDCFGCHAANYNDAAVPQHAASGFPTTCLTCHTTAAWQPSSWNHANTGFALTGAHATVVCTSCHANGQWVGLPQDCYSCHTATYNSASDPPHASLNFPHDCTQCHNTATWGDGTFDHASTGFALTGVHATAACTSCHANGQWLGLPQDCYSCHAASYNTTTSPQHAASGFPTTCQTCHTTAAWQPSSWNHANTGFALTGAHATAVCTSCHTNGQWAGLPQDCYSCHAANYTSTTSPQHAASGFPTTCQTCHTTAAWQPSSWNHANTGFALTGAHATLVCTSCHANGQWAGLPQDCYGCHSANYNSANDPPHATLNFPHDCAQCHNTGSWGDGTFDHTSTGFALTGAHATAVCTSCHANGQWLGLPQDCYGCHAANYTSTTSPQHAASGFPTTCVTCHTTAAWQPSSWNHASTGFALTGAHVTAVCTSCHANGQWAGLPQDCYACHAANYTSTTSPQHAASGFPTTCQTCHTTAAWQPSSWNHANTGFALTGAHATAVCTSCHANGQWAGLPQDCYSCHTANYNSAADPPHATLNFPHDCTQCHTTASWGGGTFDHTSTGFALTGAHATVACTSCHANGQWVGLPQDCYGCHAFNYNAAANPPHAASGFPTACQTCHTTAAWQPSSWSHTSTGFALTGVHATVVCTSCHVNGQWAGLPQDCYSCHASNYNATTNPQHAAAHFPTTCQTCHTTAAWSPSTWNHDPLFPINSGAHQSVWTSCATCHLNPNDYSLFECINCHTHNQAQTNSQHSEVAGYQYLSTACYGCHPNGRSGN